MTEITSANMVGFSAGTNNFTNYQSLQLLKHKALSIVDKSIESNNQFRKELALLIKAKNGNIKSQNLILNSFTKDIRYWSNQYINKYIPKKDEFFLELVNVGYLIVKRRIDQISLEELIQKEKSPKGKTKKTWFYNNTNMWIRSYIKAKVEKIKKDFFKNNECSIDSIENKSGDEFLSDLNNNDKKDLIKKCNVINPINLILHKEEKNEIKNNLKKLINELSINEKKIIGFLYFDENLTGNHSQKIKELSKKLKVSDKRIYFLHSSAIKKLKNKFKSLNDKNKNLLKEHV